MSDETTVNSAINGRTILRATVSGGKTYIIDAITNRIVFYIDGVIGGGGVKVMTTEERLATTPAEGELIYDSELEALYVGDGVTAGGVEIEGGGGSTLGDNLVVPPKHYAVVGREANIYYDNLFKCTSELFLVDANATAGYSQNERYTYTPAETGDVTVHVRVRNLNDYTLLATSDTVLYVAAASDGAGLNVKCSFIGDSIMQSGWITGALLDIAENDDMKITLIGLRGSGSNRHEGRGGFSIALYTSEAATYYKFTVSGVTTAPRINGTTYTFGGSEFKVQEVELSDGSGSITCQLLSGSAPSGSGILTKSNQFEGDAQIAFSAVEDVPANPFWFNGEVNYAAYLTAHSFAKPDFVFIQLGTNDVFRQTTDDGVRTFCETAFANYDTLIESIQSAGVKYVALMLCPPGAATQDAFGAGYGASVNRDRVHRNYVVWNEEMVKKWGDSEEDGIFIVPSNIGLDAYHNYPFAVEAPANSRTSMTVLRQNNGVHPAQSGAGQIADTVWAFLKNKSNILGASYTVTLATGTTDGSLYYGVVTDSSLFVTFDSSLNGTAVDFENSVIAEPKIITGNGVGTTLVSGTVKTTSDTELKNLSLAGVTVASGGVMILSSGAAVAPSTSLTMSGATVTIAGATVNGTLVPADGSCIISSAVADGMALSGGTVSLANGAIVTGAGSGNINLGGNNFILPSFSSATFESCVISGGSSPATGGAFRCSTAVLNLNSCTITGNAASGAARGGGIEGYATTATIIDCTISGNSGGVKDCFWHNVTAKAVYSNSYIDHTTCDQLASVTLVGSNKIGEVKYLTTAANRCGILYIESGAIVDLQGNANATPLMPGGGIIVASGDTTKSCTIINSAGVSVVVSGGTYATIAKDGTVS